MKPGDKIELIEDIRTAIGVNTFLDFSPGLTGIIVSNVNSNGFCTVQLDMGKMHLTTYVHKSQLKALKTKRG